MSVQEQLEEIAEQSGAELAFSAHHIESGERFTLSADRPFPLCSVFKIPVLVEAMRQIGEGHFSIDDRWTLTDEAKNLPSGVLVFFEEGLAPTVLDLLTLMIIISDNTATDMIMERLGQDATTHTMGRMGFPEISVPLTVRNIFEDILPSADPGQSWGTIGFGDRNYDGVAYSNGAENNVGTPDSLTRLLVQIFNGEILDREACDQMLAILLKQQLNDRLPRFLPVGTRCAHKTGTLAGIRNDSGIIYVNETNHVAVTVFSRWDHRAVEQVPRANWERMLAIDSAIGEIGRTLFDFYSNT